MLRHTDGRGINTSQRNRPTQFNMFRKPLAVATNLKTGNPMDAQRIVQNCVLKNQKHGYRGNDTGKPYFRRISLSVRG